MVGEVLLSVESTNRLFADVFCVRTWEKADLFSLPLSSLRVFYFHQKGRKHFITVQSSVAIKLVGRVKNCSLGRTVPWVTTHKIHSKSFLFRELN